MKDPLTRFSNRVENYIKYRPRYPREVLETLCSDCGLTPKSVIADIGSGTGIFSELFLANGNVVFAVEPNLEMRNAAESAFSGRAGFKSLAGTAESTALPDSSVDFLVAAQAFHWFDPEKSRVEFRRILRPGGWVVIVWNDRLIDTSPFLAEYEELLRYCAGDYKEVNHRRITREALGAFFEPSGFRTRNLSNQQQFDFEGLRGRLLSSSYAPAPGEPGHESMLTELKNIFDRHQDKGKITLDYMTKMYYGRW